MVKKNPIKHKSTLSLSKKAKKSVETESQQFKGMSLSINA
jgi:hypothetical protein